MDPGSSARKHAKDTKNSKKHSFAMGLVKKLTIQNGLGLHARAAAKIVDLAGKYRSQVFLKKEDREVDGSSILSILTLSCPKGTEIEVRTEGEDAEALLQALNRLFEQKFDEDK